MKNQNSFLVILIVIVLFISCGKSEQQIKEEKEEVIKQMTEKLIVKNDKAISELNLKYNSISGWDTLNYYTYALQEMFIDEKKLVSFNGEIKNITKSDSSYIIKLFSSNWDNNSNFIAFISITPEKFKEFKKKVYNNNYSSDGCFIFKASKIISASNEIKSDFDGEYSYLDYDFDETLLIFNGELIDFYLNEVVDVDNIKY